MATNPHFKKHRAFSKDVFKFLPYVDAIGFSEKYHTLPIDDDKYGSGKYHTLPFNDKYGSGKYHTLPVISGQTGSGPDIVFDNEHHLKLFGQRHNFTGPGTQVKLRERLGAPYNTPVNDLDACSRSHDLSFTSIGESLKNGSINRDQMKKLVRVADKKYIDCANSANASNMGETAEKMIAAQIIKGKMALEDIGVMNPESFIKDNSKKTVGSGLYKFGNRKLNRKSQNGEGIPGILLGALASYIVPKILETIYDKIRK